MTSLKRIVRAIVVDASPLRGNRNFQMYFVSRATSSAARQMIIVAVPIQVYAITESSLAVGLIGAAQLVPILAVSMIGGALADAIDRRKLLIVGQLLISVTCVGLAAYAFADALPVWPIYALVTLNASIFAIEQPTRAAVLPTIVTQEELPSALALNQVLGQLAKAGVPAAAGFLVVIVGSGYTYLIAASMAIVGAVAVIWISSLPPVGGGTAFGIGSIIEGLRYLKRAPLIMGTLVMDLNAMVFGMPSALFPEIGTRLLGGDASTVGLLYAAPGIGALIAALTSGWLRGIQRQGMTIVTATVIWGVAITMFGFSDSVLLAVLLLGIAGAADVISAVFRNTVVQLTVTDDLRGRISAVHIATVTGGPRLGDLEAGVVAAVTSTRFSVVSGGVACSLGALLIARLIPQLARYRRPDPTSV